MNVRITKPIKGGGAAKAAFIKAIASKSQAHRLLICAAVYCARGMDSGVNSETFIACKSRSDDIDSTARCLEALGAIVKYSPDGFHVIPINQQKKHGSEFSALTAKLPVLDCGESGSTLRFLLPVCGALGQRVSLNMGGRLPSRPLSALYSEMVSHGCTLSEQGKSPLLCEGQLKSGTYVLPGNVSSQFVSGLLFALPVLPQDSSIRVTGVLESRPYVDMTLDALRLFGISINEEDDAANTVFHIQGGQTGYSPGTVQVEGDWSNAAFWLAAGAIGAKGITCIGLNPNSRQGDRAVIELLARFGANISADSGSVTVFPGKLRGIDIDAQNIPDLVPILAAVASVAEGKTVIRNAGRLRIKESDRLNTVAASLSSLGADITETEDGLVIIGKDKLKGGETESFGDHRIAMAAAIISGACASPVLIKNAEAVNKSYPEFFNDFAALGAISEAV